jgi:hypothetical protein
MAESGSNNAASKVTHFANGQGIAYRVNDLQAGCGRIAVPQSVLAVDLRALSGCCEQPIDGILGVDFFRSRIVQIDFHQGQSPDTWKVRSKSRKLEL